MNRKNYPQIGSFAKRLPNVDESVRADDDVADVDDGVDDDDADGDVDVDVDDRVAYDEAAEQLQSNC